MEEKGLSKCRKDKDHDLWYKPGPPAEFSQVNTWSVALQWAATAYSEMTASTRCTRNAEGSSAWQRTLITDVHSARELYAAWRADHRKVQVQPIELEVFASSCYLGDMLSAADGCEPPIITRVKTAWKKFKELLPVLSSRNLSFKTRGPVYSSCAECNAPCQ